MLFISDVHHGLDSLKLLPKSKEPLVILGDLINWIDYRNGDGIAKDVFGGENLNKLIQLRKDHNFDERKNLWQELFAKDPKRKQQEIEDAIERQYKEVFEVLKDYEVWMIPGNVDSLKIFESVKTNNVRNVDGQVLEYKNHKIGFAGGGVPTPIKARGEISEQDFEDKLNKLVDVDHISINGPDPVTVTSSFIPISLYFLKFSGICILPAESKLESIAPLNRALRNCLDVFSVEGSEAIFSDSSNQFVLVST